MWFALAQEGGPGPWFMAVVALYFLGVGCLLLVDPKRQGTRLMRRLWAERACRMPDAGKLRRLSLVMGSGFLFLGLAFGALLTTRLI